MQITEDDLIFEISDDELLVAVEKFLTIQAHNFEYARYKGIPVDPESIAMYGDWVEYWRRLRVGQSLSLFDVKDICGSGCTVQVVASKPKSKYLVKLNPNIEEWS